MLGCDMSMEVSEQSAIKAHYIQIMMIINEVG